MVICREWKRRSRSSPSLTSKKVTVGDVDFRWASDENNEPTQMPRLRFGRQKLK